MEIIAHRRNTARELAATSHDLGVEIDIRSWNGELILQHDSQTPGELLDQWLDNYAHGTLILNVKEEGLEEPLLHLMAERGITDYFFLDQSFPFLLKYAQQGRSKAAVRVSEFETMGTALKLSGLVDWVWIDYFSTFPITAREADALRSAGFLLCAVSPELQGFDPNSEVSRLRSELETHQISLDAVCTKVPELWTP